jgi:hypothetical protein
VKNITSLGSKEFSLGKSPSSPRRRGTFLGEQCTLLLSSPRKHIFQKNLQSIISFLFLYAIATYCWKGSEESYNFVGGNISIKIHSKSYDQTKFQTLFFLKEIETPSP